MNNKTEHMVLVAILAAVIGVIVFINVNDPSPALTDLELASAQAAGASQCLSETAGTTNYNKCVAESDARIAGQMEQPWMTQHSALTSILAAVAAFGLGMLILTYLSKPTAVDLDDVDPDA